MSFRITGLPAAPFAPLFRLSGAELARRNAARMVATEKPGFPCRVSLRDAEPGETVLLLNYEHLSAASPYRSRHAIFVRENAVEARLQIDEIPEVLQIRLLSVRAFDSADLMIDADVVPGTELGPALDRMLENRTAKYLHIHNAKAGCFAARADRA